MSCFVNELKQTKGLILCHQPSDLQLVVDMFNWGNSCSVCISCDESKSLCCH